MAEIEGVTLDSGVDTIGRYAQYEQYKQTDGLSSKAVAEETASTDQIHHPDAQYETTAPLFNQKEQEERKRYARENHGYNLAGMWVELHAKAFEYKERVLSTYLSQVNQLNIEMETINKLNNVLSQSREKKKANFEEDAEVKQWIDMLHEKNERLFKDKYKFETESDFDNAIKSLDGLSNMKATEMQEVMMYVQSEYDDRGSFTDNARKALDMIDQEYKKYLQMKG